MTGHHYLRQASRRQGAVLIIAMITLVVGVMVAVVSLMFSRQHIITSGHQRGKLTSSYVAEAATNKALAIIRQRVAAGTWYYNVNDPTLRTNCIGEDPDCSASVSGDNSAAVVSYCPDENCLFSWYDSTGTDAIGNCESAYNWGGSEDAWLRKATDANADDIQVTGQVICDFLADNKPSDWGQGGVPDVRVSVVRHPDHRSIFTGQSAAVYLVSAVARTADKRRHVRQSVVLLPLTFNKVLYSVRDPQSTAFIASTVNFN